MITSPPPTEWLEGQMLALRLKLVMPRLPEHCADPSHAITDDELAAYTFSAHEHDRLRLVRSFPSALVIIARHASGALVAVSTKHLLPVSDS